MLYFIDNDVINYNTMPRQLKGDSFLVYHNYETLIKTLIFRYLQDRHYYTGELYEYSTDIGRRDWSTSWRGYSKTIC